MTNPHQALIDQLRAEQATKRKKKTEQFKANRDNWTQEKRDAHNARQRESQARFRANMSEEKRAETNEKHRQYMKDNADLYKGYSQQLRYKYKCQAIELLGGVCSDCSGTFHPAAYDFHHTNPEEKDIEIGRLLNRSWKSILVELEKCILLCANCHRTRHAVGYNRLMNEGDQIDLIKPED